MYCTMCECHHQRAQFSARQRRKPSNARVCRDPKTLKCCSKCVGGCIDIGNIEFDVYLETTITPEWRKLSNEMMKLWIDFDCKSYEMQQEVLAKDCSAKQQVYLIAQRVLEQMIEFHHQIW
jgi:hypothetical protein